MKSSHNIRISTLHTLCFVITLVIIFLLNDSIDAQNNQVDFVKLNVELSQNTVSCIYQDSAGFMWFGTQNGLNKYNGIQTTIYENIPDDTNSITENTINKIIEGYEGEIWIATNGGLNVLKKDDYTFTRFISDSSINSLSISIISDLLKDYNNNIWVVAEYPSRYIRDKNCFKVYPIDYSEVSSEPIFLFQDKKNNLWLFHHKEIFLYDEIKDTFQLVFDGDDYNLNENTFYSDVVEYQDGSWYVAANYSGILPMKVINNTLSIDYSDEILKKRELQSIQRILDLHIDKNNTLWVGSENKGLFSYSLINNELRNHVFDPTNDESIRSNSIWSIFEDKQNRLWFGTYSDGISLIDKNHSKFKHYKSNSSDQGPSYNNITDFVEDELGNIWIGTDGGGLNYFDRKTNHFTFYKNNPLDRNSLSADAVLSLCLDDEGKLWIGTWDGGISILNTKSGNFKFLNTRNSNLTSNRVFDIENTGKGEMYIASFGEGIDVYNQKSKSWKNYKYDPPNNNSLNNNNTIKIVVDSIDNVWICTQFGGLNKIGRNTDGTLLFEQFMHNPNNPNSISNNSIQDVFIDRKNTVWSATQTGLNILNKQNKTFNVLTKANGLPTNSIQSIIDDENGDLWLGTLEGLSHFRIKDSIFVNYTSQDGLQGEKFSKNSAYRLKSGELLFGGTNGLNIFHPNSITKNTQKPSILFTDFKLFNKSVMIDQNSPLRMHIERTDEIELTHKQSVFTIEFVALSYTHPDKNQYAFYLEGLEDEWNYVGYQRNATYTNLDPGKYIFHVKASNNDGVWNEEGISLLITVVPPFWKTWLFRILVFILVTSLVVVYFSLRLLAVKKTNEKLEIKVKERTNELRLKNDLLIKQSVSLNETNSLLEERQQLIEEQSEELLAQRDELSDVNAVKDKLFSVIAHDLKNPFSPLLGISELLLLNYDLYNDKKRKIMLGGIYESSNKIYNLLVSLFNWSRSQRGEIKPKFEKANIVEVLISNIDLAGAQSANKEIEINNRVEYEEILLYFDLDLINTVVRNLLNNAIKFTPIRGEIIVSCKKDIDRVLISIKDNGVGISDGNIKRLFKNSTLLTTAGTNNETGTGLGLTICKDFVGLHNGEIWVTSKEGDGSEFCFSIPLQRK